MRHADWSHGGAVAGGGPVAQRWTVPTSPAGQVAGVLGAAGEWRFIPVEDKTNHELFLWSSGWGTKRVEVAAVYHNGYVHVITAAAAANQRVLYVGKPAYFRYTLSTWDNGSVNCHSVHFNEGDTGQEG